LARGVPGQFPRSTHDRGDFELALKQSRLMEERIDALKISLTEIYQNMQFKKASGTVGNQGA